MFEYSAHNLEDTQNGVFVYPKVLPKETEGRYHLNFRAPVQDSQNTQFHPHSEENVRGSLKKP